MVFRGHVEQETAESRTPAAESVRQFLQTGAARDKRGKCVPSTLRCCSLDLFQFALSQKHVLHTHQVCWFEGTRCKNPTTPGSTTPHFVGVCDHEWVEAEMLRVYLQRIVSEIYRAILWTLISPDQASCHDGVPGCFVLGPQTGNLVFPDATSPNQATFKHAWSTSSSILQQASNLTGFHFICLDLQSHVLICSHPFRRWGVIMGFCLPRGSQSCILW